MIRTLLLVAFATFIYGNVSASCAYCTSLKDALEKPLKVIELDLHAQGLLEFPATLNQFVNLKTLNLSSNLIENINFSYVKLPALEELNLSNNPGFNTMELRREILCICDNHK